jgi:hypothetical protein
LCLLISTAVSLLAAEPEGAGAGGGRIPVDLLDAVRSLEEIIPAGDIGELKQDGDGDAVATREAALEVAIRSRWNLWQPSALVDYFHSKGVEHPDHMSGIILQAWMDARAGRKIDEDSVFRAFPSWLNAPAELEVEGTLAHVLGGLRVRATEIARVHFENRAAVVAFSDAFDPAKAVMHIHVEASGQSYHDVLTSVCAQAGLSYAVVSPYEIRLMDAIR